MRYKEYKTGDVLNFDSSNGIFHACNVTINDEKTDTNHPYVVRTSQNNGIRGYISEDESKLNPENTISFAQDTAQMFYQKEAYFTGNKVKVLSAKGHVLTKEIALFLISCLNKAFSNFVWGSSYDTNILKNTTIKLPVKTVYKPDLILISEILAGGGTDMSNIDTSSWKEFKLGELFDIENTWVYGKNKQYHSQLKSKTVNSIAVVSGVTTNNGINYYTEDVLDDNEIYNDCLTISTRGEYSGSVFYHDYPFVLANNILAMPMPELSKEAKLFIATVIQALPFGGYGNYPTKDKLKEATIKLPVKESEEIDWDYMQERISELEQERISELEQERISELEQYLIAAGLNDYELTDEDKEILATKLTDGVALQSSTSVNGCLKETKITQNFFIGKTNEHSGLFKQLRGKESAPNRVPDGIINMVNETSSNNGITKKAFSEHVFEAPAITVSVNFAQTAFLQDESFCASVNILILKSEWLKKYPKAGEYVATYLKKNNQRYTYSSKISKDRLNDTIISLPIQTDSQNNPIIDSTHTYHPQGYIPDWEYMEKYIKATEKVVIQDVVDWKNEMIEKTKEVVANRSDASQDIQPLDAQ